MPKKKTKEEFIQDAREKHGDKYDYSKVDYVNANTKVCIMCPKHGKFEQRPGDHTQGKGCPKCRNEATGERCRSSKEDFIKKSLEIHKGKYDYSNVNYVNSKTKVSIICPKHGEFWQAPTAHLSGSGCYKCGVENRSEKRTLTKEEFIKKANEKHNGKYDYSKVEYMNNHTKVCIICSKHGEFWQIPHSHSHTQGQGCPKCSNENKGEYCRLSKEDFIKKAIKVHGDKYNYSKVDYVNCETKVCIICPEHDEFWQTPSKHLSGQGCPKCGGRYVPTTEEWITSARLVHRDKYDYSKVNYVSAHTKVCIICPEHDEFWQSPSQHLSGSGCPKCGGCYVPTTEEWVVSARLVHGDKYDYSKVDYVNKSTKICIICHEHGEFEQTPHDHTQGCGCPKCNLSHLERDVMKYLDDIGITYVYQKRFDWLGLQSLDFYLPDYNVGIECQGGQHFFPVDFAGKGVEWACKEFDKLIERDKCKKALCEKHGVKLLYFGNVPNYDTFLGEVVHDDVQDIIDYLEEHKIDRDKPTTE